MNSGTSSINPKFARDFIIGSVCGGALSYLGCETACANIGFLLAGPPGAALAFFSG